MKPIYSIAILLYALSTSAHAFSNNAERQGEFGSRVDGIRAGMFAEYKAIESYSHKQRIRILQEAEACIQSAADRDQYRVCEQREEQAREQVKETVKAQHDALKAKAEGRRSGMISRR